MRTIRHVCRKMKSKERERERGGRGGGQIYGWSYGIHTETKTNRTVLLTETIRIMNKSMTLHKTAQPN